MKKNLSVLIALVFFTTSIVNAQQGISPELIKTNKKLQRLSFQIDSIAAASNSKASRYDELAESDYKIILRLRDETLKIQEYIASFGFRNNLDLMYAWRMLDKTEPFDIFKQSPLLQSCLEFICIESKAIVQPSRYGALGYEIVLTTKKPLADYDPEQILIFIMFFNPGGDVYWEPSDVKKAAEKLRNAGGDFYTAEAKWLEVVY